MTWKSLDCFLVYKEVLCFSCLWDSLAKSDCWVWKTWPERREFRIGEKPVFNWPLVNPSNVLLLPLHMKLGLMKQRAKAVSGWWLLQILQHKVSTLLVRRLKMVCLMRHRIKTKESRYQDRWNTNIMADYCWSLQRHCCNASYSHDAAKTKFSPWVTESPVWQISIQRCIILYFV